MPTMGALHDGHRALFAAARARERARRRVALRQPGAVRRGRRPRRVPARRGGATRAIAEECGVDVLFAPSADEIYPDGFGTWVDVEDTGAEGDARPGHFRGVATVCLKLFNIVRPARAYFGQKDAQQALVIRRMVRDLNLDLEVRVLPTVRDEDGLALSSRNARLSAGGTRGCARPPSSARTRRRGVPPRRRRSRRHPQFPERPRPRTTSRSSSSTARRSLLPPSGSATTRLIDNVLLKGALT